MSEDRTSPPPGSPRQRELTVFNTNLLMFIWWPVPAASFLFVSAIFLVAAVVLDIVVITSPTDAAIVPQVSAVTVLLGLLTAYGVWAYQGEKEKARETDVPRRIK